MLPTLPDDVSVLDVGCGPGRQTVLLAKHLKGTIKALDSHQAFLDQLQQRPAGRNKARIEAICRPMDADDFKENEFDLIWSEGALYSIGVEESLKSFRKILKSPGYIAFTELSLFTNDRHSQAARYWKSAYPDVKSIEENLEMISQAGYSMLGHFKLPPSDWQEYYRPLSEKIKILREKYSDDPSALQALQDDADEINLYAKHGNEYGYVFYILSRD